MAGRPARRARRRPGREEPAGDGSVDLGPPADPESVARTIVLTKLTGQARSRAELAEALAGRDVPDDVAVRVLDRFAEVGLVDDVEFADTWVRTRQESRGLSRRALSQELRRKGVDEEIAREAVDQVTVDHEWSAATRLVERKLRATRGVERQKRYRRLVGMLARKGYGSGIAMGVVAEALRAEGHGEDVAAEHGSWDDVP